jgi:hypothetical protein
MMAEDYCIRSVVAAPVIAAQVTAIIRKHQLPADVAVSSIARRIYRTIARYILVPELSGQLDTDGIQLAHGVDRLVRSPGFPCDIIQQARPVPLLGRVFD